MVSLIAQAGLELTTKSRMILNFELFIFPNAGVTVWLRAICCLGEVYVQIFAHILITLFAFLVPTYNDFLYFEANLLPDDSVFYLGFIFFSHS